MNVNTLLLVPCFAVVLYVFSLLQTPVYAQPAIYVATTTVSLTVCGDALVSGAELCDDGFNTGAYASSIALRNCNPVCRAYGPYCGDGVIQTFYGEECDDSNNTAGDLCDPTCQNESDPVTEGGGGSGGNSGGGGGGGTSGTGQTGIQGASTEGNIPFNGETEVVVEGRAYPGATVTILKDGDIERVLEAGSDSTFSYTFTELTPGITTLGFWAVDRAGRKSITFASTFQVIENAITTLSGILLPPTLSVEPEKVAPGGTVSFTGTAIQNGAVKTDVNNTEHIDETIAAPDGSWTIAFDTSVLAGEQFHTVKANYTDRAQPDLRSGYSQLKTFYVGTGDVKMPGSADLNNDGLVNLTDFSILLFNWNTASAVADINQDGTVSLPDFSIMLFNWTG